VVLRDAQPVPERIAGRGIPVGVLLEVAEQVLLQAAGGFSLQPREAGFQRVVVRGEAAVGDVDAVLGLRRLPLVLGQGKDQLLKISNLDFLPVSHRTAFWTGTNTS
jgi:hypothetical protein